MKIVFTTGGTGGHFYPVIAVAEAINRLASESHQLPPKLYYFSPEAYDAEMLFENGIEFVRIPAGKLRRYFSFKNFTDLFVTVGGVFTSFSSLLRLYPDVVFSKGGFGSVPTVLAAWVLRIPIIIHESDSKPGKANLFAAPLAKRIAISFDSSRSFFSEKVQGKISLTGIPIRGALTQALPTTAPPELGLDLSLPTILILGGSSGSKRINETVLQALPQLTLFANVIHQTGRDLYQETLGTSTVILGTSPTASRYHAYPFLTRETLRSAAGAASLIISRAGATSITEISLWGKPAILIPIPERISHDQRTNAYAYAHTGAAAVLEEDNMTPNILASEARRISLDPVLCAKMSAAGTSFAPRDAALLIARELLSISASHLKPTDETSSI